MSGANKDPVTIDSALCTGCQRCVVICPTDVMRMDDASGKAIVAFPEDCHACFLCVEDCEPRAIALDPSVANARHRSVYADLDDAALVLRPAANAKY
jgi:NAD-dependent dihydropyrimidine dehydrogenase PreA subunit